MRLLLNKQTVLINNRLWWQKQFVPMLTCKVLKKTVPYCPDLPKGIRMRPTVHVSRAFYIGSGGCCISCDDVQ